MFLYISALILDCSILANAYENMKFLVLPSRSTNGCTRINRKINLNLIFYWMCLCLREMRER